MNGIFSLSLVPPPSRCSVAEARQKVHLGGTSNVLLWKVTPELASKGLAMISSCGEEKRKKEKAYLSNGLSNTVHILPRLNLADDTRVV